MQYMHKYAHKIHFNCAINILIYILINQSIYLSRAYLCTYPPHLSVYNRAYGVLRAQKLT